MYCCILGCDSLSVWNCQTGTTGLLQGTRFALFCFIYSLNTEIFFITDPFENVSHRPITRQGLVPAGIRLIPHTVLTFIFLEQLKKYFGIRVVSWTLTSWPFPFGLLLKLLSLLQYYFWKISHYSVITKFTMQPDQHDDRWFLTIWVPTLHEARLRGERRAGSTVHSSLLGEL